MMPFIENLDKQNGQFFHDQYMQSRLLSIPENPLTAFCAMIRVVSSSLEHLK
jgi:hypothetical protein